MGRAVDHLGGQIVKRYDLRLLVLCAVLACQTPRVCWCQELALISNGFSLTDPIAPTGYCTDGLLGSDDCDRKRDLSLCETIDKCAVDSKTFGPRFSRIEYQRDSRGFNYIHFMGASQLPHEFHIWGFIDLEGLDTPTSNGNDLARYFLEIDIKRRIGEHWGAIAELNDLQGDGNGIGRFGVFYLAPWEFLKANDAWLSFKLFPGQTDGGSQYSFAYNKNFLGVFDDRLNVGGFFDVNVNAGPTGNRTVIVTEHQIRLRLVDQMFALCELRLNEFLPAGQRYGTGFGLQCRF